MPKRLRGFAGCFLVFFAMLVLSASPARGELVYGYDFEAGWDSWSVDNGVWEVGTPTAGPTSCHGGTQCAGTILGGNYPQDTDSRLISPSIRLPNVSGSEGIQLHFWQWFAYSQGDGGYVQISVFDEATGEWSAWANLKDTDPLCRAISEWDESGGWTPKSCELTAYAGKAVRVAFYHTACYCSYGYVSTGWYIDDIQITGITPIVNPFCDIQLNKTTFVNGDQGIAQILRLANPGAVPVPIELGIWFEVPGIPPVSFVNTGADGSVKLTAGFNQNFGPMPLFTVTSAFPRGTYGFNCRIINPVTKQPLAEDRNSFTIQ